MKKTREQWLNQATNKLKPIFRAAGMDIPAVNLSCSWPGGRGKKNTAIGQCWPRSASAAGINEVFISPTIEDSVRCLDILAHELIHAWDDNKHGHGAVFARKARAIGLEGKPTATHAGEELAAKLQVIVDKIGEYPHKKVTAGGSGKKKQGTRMIKIECNDCGAIFRMSRQWAEQVTTCPVCESHEVEASL